MNEEHIIKTFLTGVNPGYSTIDKWVDTIIFFHGWGSKIDAADVKLMYAQFLSDQYTLYPTKSLTQNIGHDGTGIHCCKSHKFDVTLSEKTTFRFPDDPAVDPRIVKANFTFRKDTIYQQARAFVASRTPMPIKHLLRRALQQL